MAGGIFVEQPFHFNIKCVVFSIVLILCYWLLPSKQVVLVPMIFITGYIAMAWYDFMYNCDIQLHSGTSILGIGTFDAWGKPQRRNNSESKENKTKKVFVKDQEAAYVRNVNWFHILGVMPFFVWANYTGGSPGVTAALWVAMLWVVIYHGTRLFVMPREVSERADVQEKETSRLRGVYVLHLLGIAPLLAYTAMYGSNSGTNALAGAGIFAGVYHGFRRMQHF